MDQSNFLPPVTALRDPSPHERQHPDRSADAEEPEGLGATRCQDGSVDVSRQSHQSCVSSGHRDISLKQKIIAAFDENPKRSTKEIVSITGADISHVQRVLRETGLRESRRIGHRILETHFQHPDWKPRRIAEHVGCSIYHVRRMLTWAPMDELRSLGLAARAAGLTLKELLAMAAQRAASACEAAE